MIATPTPASLFLLLLVQLIATCAMLGVIWFVQLVTYPQFAELKEPGFLSYHEHYSARVTWVVAPLMLVELGTALLSVLFFRGSELAGLALAGFLLVLALWALTAFVQVPQHTRLSYGHSLETVHALVKGNWSRTILWTAKTAIAALLLYRFVTSGAFPK